MIGREERRKGRKEEEKREKGTFYLLVYFQVVPRIQVVPGQNQESGTPSRSPTWLAGAQALA